MLVNIPTARELNEIALRLYFDAWQRTVTIISNFKGVYQEDGWPWARNSAWAEEWMDYVSGAQSEMGAIASTAQQASEVRLKSIICETSPYILLLKSDLKYKVEGGDIDFADQRTLDAADLPSVVMTLTPFNLPKKFMESYQALRRLRNKVMHVGKQQDYLDPLRLIYLLCEQYIALWPDGHWLSRRVEFDGNSASTFFHDGRWSSAYSEIMDELAFATPLFDNALFQKCIGTKKSALKGHCPVCLSRTASKSGSGTIPTAATISTLEAKCFMCESTLILEQSDVSCYCGSSQFASTPDDEPCCYECGAPMQ